MNNTKHTKEQIRERIQQKKILFDGAFGTYYGGKHDTRQLPELANLEAPERVKEIHREYLEAGAQILRTNTFAANSFCMIFFSKNSALDRLYSIRFIFSRSSG